MLMRSEIRLFRPEDAPFVSRLMQLCLERGETLYRPWMPDLVQTVLSGDGMTGWIASLEGNPCGIACTAEKTVFLPGETPENTPLFLTLLMVSPGMRLQGIGKQLLQVVVNHARQMKKKHIVISGDSPCHLTWLIPGTQGHDHNNAPGVWKEGPFCAWLTSHGFHVHGEEISLYLPLSSFRWNPELDVLKQKLEAEGILTGTWHPSMGRDFDGMCDRVGSEYWRHVLRTETDAWIRQAPNADPDLWPDGRKPAGPRPLLTAVRDGQIIGFTGPVDRQESGRGWFTGICVDPLFEKRGIATLLFHLLLRAFQEKDALFCSIFTGAENHAQRIYLRAGFRVTSHWQILVLPLEPSEEYHHIYY